MDTILGCQFISNW